MLFVFDPRQRGAFAAPSRGIRRAQPLTWPKLEVARAVARIIRPEAK